MVGPDWGDFQAAKPGLWGWRWAKRSPRWEEASTVGVCRRGGAPRREEEDLSSGDLRAEDGPACVGRARARTGRRQQSNFCRSHGAGTAATPAGFQGAGNLSSRVGEGGSGNCCLSKAALKNY